MFATVKGRQTWEPGFGDTETSHEDFRELGALKAGYWCDQRLDESNFRNVFK